MQAKVDPTKPTCQQHKQPIKLICIDTHCTSNPLVCSMCLCEKHDYHKSSKGMIHQLRDLQPLIDKAHIIEKTSEERYSRINAMTNNYFDYLRSKLLALVDHSQAEFLQRIRHESSSSTLTKAETEVIQHIKNGAYDQILPSNLAHGADKIMSFEFNEDLAQVCGLIKHIQPLLKEANVDDCLKNIPPGDILSRLLLKGWHPSASEFTRSPLLEYDKLIVAYHRLQGPLDWRNCGNCYFSVALFRQEQPGSERMYKELAAAEDRSVVSQEHPGNGGSFNNDCARDGIFKSAMTLTAEIKQKLHLKDIYNDILVIHGKPAGWAYNAEEGSMAAFGGPSGKGFSFCRGGEKAKKKIHLFVFN